ncbi:LysR family transcriptional regulator [Neisseria shayeganii]|uniref:LysR family transcriptional regulator n=1 Tax=Neisseria shayeganii TaxID=607712 RepID=A0A7D7S8S8_9NEIS|nr:LysR family transcriptional regulator [Neisseria shayeganii]QMT40991.1 LysR family transcriptional regulator [Neisseria shayeganii]
MGLLDDMALFVEVVKAKGFRGAAQKLGLPGSTVSRRVSALEKNIGLRLLNRTTRKVELTEAGAIYYERCRYIVEEAAAAHLALSEMVAQPAGTLRLSVASDVARFLIAPFLPEFAERYPHIGFDFDLSDRHVDLVGEPVDLAIRVGQPADSLLIAYPLATLCCRLYAAPGYLKKYGTPENPESLARHQCFPRTARQKEWTLTRGSKEVKVPIQSRFTANDLSFSRHLATQGLGIIMLPEIMAAHEVASGELRILLPEWRGARLPIYALSETKLLPAKALRFIEFFKDKLCRE